METRRFETYPELCREIGEEIRQKIEECPETLLCLAAGNTSLGVFDELVTLSQNGKIDLSHSYFVAMDEWLGMNETDSGSCGDFLVRNFLSRVSIPAEHIRLVNGRAADIAAECSEIQKFIEACGGIGYLLLGCGMNGHLALNEPGTPFTASVHQSQLDAVTQKVGQKYFNSSVELRGGVTIGPKEIASAHRVVLALNTSSKRDILRRIMETAPTEDLPATFLKALNQSALYYEAEADPGIFNSASILKLV